MGMLTVVTRLTPKAMGKLKKDSSLFECLEYGRDIRELGYSPDTKPPQCGLDKAWDHLLLLLQGCGYKKQAKALETLKLLDEEREEWIRTATEKQVVKLAELLSLVDLEGLPALCAQHQVADEKGHPLQNEMLDFTVAHLKDLVLFCNETALAGDTLVVYSI